MNFELFFAKKIIKGSNNSFSKPIIRISIVAIALGIAMMTLSLSIVEGFQTEIEKKVVGFGSHIQISNFSSKGLLENKALSKNRELFSTIQSIEGVEHLQVFANKGAILKANQNNYGVVLKGVSTDYNWEFFKQYLIEGQTLQLDSNKKSDQLLISQTIAQKLELQLGDKLLAYFIQQPPRYRNFQVTGIYKTGLGEMDERMVLGDIRHLQKLNDWEESQVGGYEVLIKDIRNIEAVDAAIYEEIDYDLTSTSILDARPDIFNWLELQDINVLIIIALLILVCGIDIISALLILILERTKMIGVLKALGAKDYSIRRIFLYNAIYLILAGLFFGNIVGLSLSYLQLEYGIIGLPQDAYFIDKVPIEINLGSLLLLNLGTLVCCVLMLLIPSAIVSRIDPIKVIRFD